MLKSIQTAILLLLLTGCSALPTPMEMGEMVFVRTLGVDSVGDSLQLTASTGRRARGLQREVEPSLILSGEATSISGGLVAVAGESDQQVFYGYLDQLLLGEAYCESGILPALEYFARDVELGLGSEVWAVTGTAATAIDSGGEDGVDSKLSTLQMESLQGTAGLTQTAGQLITDILENGATYLPRLTPVGDTLISSGYTIIIGDVQVATLTGEAAQGLELLEGQPSGDVFVGDDGVVLDIWGASCRFEPVYQGELLVGAVITLEITADLAEYHTTPTQEEIDVLRTQLSQRECDRVILALEGMQEVGGDAIGLGRQLGMASPSHWAWLESHWAEVFPTLPITVTAEVTIRRSQ